MNLYRVAAILLGLVAAGVAQQPDASRDADVYAIYSQLMWSPPTGYDNNIYAIASETYPIRRPRRQDSFLAMFDTVACIRLTQAYEARWAEILAAVDLANDRPAILRPELKISKPYVLLNAEEASRHTTSIISRGSPFPVSPASGLEGAMGLFRLGNVYFDRTSTLALTSVSYTCGMLCSYGASKIFEKQTNGTWREVQPERACHMQA